MRCRFKQVDHSILITKLKILNRRSF